MTSSQDVGAKILPFRKKDKRVMVDEKDEKVTTSFTIPKRLNDLLRQDADRCHRSTVGQLIALLDAVYTGRDVELHGVENYRPAIQKPDSSQEKAA